MPPMQGRGSRVLVAFLLGTLISSIGSSVYFICLLAFTRRAGYDLGTIGLILMAGRCGWILAGFLMGGTADKLSPIKTAIVSEIFAGILSLGLIYAWRLGSEAVLLFGTLHALRSATLAVNEPARRKISKLISEADYDSNSKLAIWVNKVTHGSVIFSGLISWFLIDYMTFETVVLFDLFTFFVNGVILFLIRNEIPKTATAQSSKFDWFSQLPLLYRLNPKTALLDLCLIVSLSGANVFVVRLAGSQSVWIPVLMCSYGIAVWTSGFLERLPSVRQFNRTVWFAMGLLFILFGFLSDNTILSVVILSVLYQLHWLLFNRYTAQIQFNTPVEHAATVNGARTLQIMISIAIGELFVGKVLSQFPFLWDGLWRGALCLAVVVAFRSLSREQLAVAS